MNIFQKTFSRNLIYVFRINDDAHNNLLKIGKATISSDIPDEQLLPNCDALNEAARNRINEYTSASGIKYELLYTELAIKEEVDGNKKSFMDYDVHNVLLRSNIKKVTIEKAREWFKTDLETVKNAIKAVKEGKKTLTAKEITQDKSPIILREEQERAIKQTQTVFKNSNKMLWNAKMRFGKTVSALELVKRENYYRTIIATHRPVVDEGWHDDFNKVFYDRDDYVYIQKSDRTVPQTDKNIIYFASIPDLRGSEAVGGKFTKNAQVFQENWDCVIVDEAHEGTTTALGDEVIKNLVKEEDKTHITKFLALSGTPFNILSDYEKNAVYTWDYIMEQEAKRDWNINHFGDSNPYDSLPQMKIYTYDLGKDLNTTIYQELEDKAFNFREFFRVWTGDKKVDGKEMPIDVNIGDFVHKDDILSFLNLITKNNEKNHYPYSNETYRNYFKHSLWMLPGVKEAKALSALMKKHDIFGQFDIVNVAGDGDEEDKSQEALKKVNTAIEQALKNDGYTITLSCGKLTTGVTIPAWTAVMMLSGSYSTSAANYLQTIFRVQSAANINGQVKEYCYVFDFAPDRTLKMVADAVQLSSKAGKTSDSDRKLMGKFLNFCPIIAVDGSQMEMYDENKLLQQLKRAYADRALKTGFDDLSLYNDELLKLTDVDIEKFKNLKKIVGTSKSAPKTNEITINDQGFTDEEYEQLEKARKKAPKKRTPEEEKLIQEAKEKKARRDNAISILRAISIRIPLLIYGADIAYEKNVEIKDLLNDDVVDKASWNEFMPEGVTKEIFKDFIKYYDVDVFNAAGRRIRNIVKNADTLTPTERVKEIAHLFSYFKNPDKETVLTPWRVVNMHLSDCLGGYDFFDEAHTTLIESPRFVNQGTVTDDTLANTDAQILEINSKTGLYPLFVAYSIFRKLCPDIDNTTKEEQQKIWQAVVTKNVFVICRTLMAKRITQRTLCGFGNTKANARYFENLVDTLKDTADTFINEVSKPSYWEKKGDKMKFNAVVGNPPYHEEGNNTRKPPIYPLFYDVSFNLSNIVALISPGRFLFNAGQTSKAWNKKILEDEHFKVIRYFKNSKDVFQSVDIKGGIVISLRNAKENFGKTGLFSEYNELNAIVNKIKTLNGSSIEGINTIISPRGTYRYTPKFFKTFPYAPDRLGKGTGDMIVSNSFEKIPEAFYQEKQSKNMLKLLGRMNNKREYRYIDKDFVQNNDFICTFNVLLPKSNGTGTFGEKLSNPIICKPGEGGTDTFISIGKFLGVYEANALLKYIKTKFCRALLGIKKVTHDNPKDVWEYVPMQDFTNNSDIKWNKSISEIDKQLYDKYGLSPDEIEFIEQKIKPME